MPIRFHCQHCDARVKVPDGSQGRRMKCPRCSHLQQVPTGESDPDAHAASAKARPGPTRRPRPQPQPQPERERERERETATEAQSQAEATEPASARSQPASPAPEAAEAVEPESVEPEQVEPEQVEPEQDGDAVDESDALAALAAATDDDEAAPDQPAPRLFEEGQSEPHDPADAPDDKTADKTGETGQQPPATTAPTESPAGPTDDDPPAEQLREQASSLATPQASAEEEPPRPDPTPDPSPESEPEHPAAEHDPGELDIESNREVAGIEPPQRSATGSQAPSPPRQAPPEAIPMGGRGSRDEQAHPAPRAAATLSAAGGHRERPGPNQPMLGVTAWVLRVLAVLMLAPTGVFASRAGQPMIESVCWLIVGLALAGTVWTVGEIAAALHRGGR